VTHVRDGRTDTQTDSKCRGPRKQKYITVEVKMSVIANLRNAKKRLKCRPIIIVSDRSTQTF